MHCSQLCRAGIHSICSNTDRKLKFLFRIFHTILNSDLDYLIPEKLRNHILQNCEFRLTFVFKRSCAPFVARNLV